jgi:hypothetical protein
MMAFYKNELLKGEIEYLEKKEKELRKELKLLNINLTEKKKMYYDSEKKFYFEKGLCSSCQFELSKDEIKDKIIYCEECRNNDSVLDYHSEYFRDSL